MIFVKNIFKYLAAVIVVVIIFINGTYHFESTVSENSTRDLTSEAVSHYLNSSTENPYLYLPLPSFYANILRLHSTSKRTNNAYKNYFEFNARRINHIGIRYSIQKTVFNIPTAFIKTVHRLIRLGKLII